MATLNLFPIRVPIGTVTDSAGNSRDVMMTPEFSRALAAVFQRIGGAGGSSTEEIEALANATAVLAAFELDHLPATPAAVVEFSDRGGEVAALRGEVEQLRAELAMMKPAADLAAQVEELRAIIGMAEDPAALARFIATTAAPLKSPAFTGTPTAPTAAVGTNSTQLATTAYALAMLAAPPAIGSTTPALGSFTGITASKPYTNTSDLQLVASANIPGINLRSTGGGRFSIVTGYIAADTSSVLLATGTGNPGTEAMRFNHASGAINFPTSSITVATGFGCNGKAAQTAVASGGTLAGVISALVANGILSS